MKNFIYVLCALILACGTKIVSYAAPADPDGWENDPVLIALAESVNENWGYSLTDVEKKRLWDYGFNPQDNYYLVLVKYPNNLNYYWSNNLSTTNSVITMSTGYMMLTYTNGTADYNTLSNYQITVNENTQIIGYYLDVIQGDPEIDYSIPVPDARMVTIDNEGINWNEEPRNNFKLQIKTPNVNLTNLMVEVQVKYYTPSKVYIDTYMWNNSEFRPAEYIISPIDNIVPLASKKLLTSLPVNTSDDYRWQVDLNVNDGWENFVNTNVTANVPRFYWAASGDEVTQGSALLAIGKYTAQQKYLPSSFNICEVFVRYFKQENNQIKVGQWLHLKNDTTLDNEALNVQIPVFNPPVSQNTSPVIELPDDENSIGTGVWVPGGNGTGVSVVVQNNMPDQNTLNYPTIVSYNKDVVFKEWADFSKGIPDFFTSITNFGAMAFAFIPDEIWAIISMGLVLSIAVMVIKIL